METVISSVVALCMFIAGELKEHRIQQSMSDCLKGKRVASRNIDKKNTTTYRSYIYQRKIGNF